MNAYFPLKCEENIRMNAHFLPQSDKSFWQSLQSNAEDYELLVVKVFDDACSVHKKFSSVSNRSMISCSRLVDFNPTFGLHKTWLSMVCTYPAWYALFFWFCM